MWSKIMHAHFICSRARRRKSGVKKTWFNFCTYLVLYFFRSCIGTLLPFQPFIATFSMGSFWMNKNTILFTGFCRRCCCHCWSLSSGEKAGEYTRLISLQCNLSNGRMRSKMGWNNDNKKGLREKITHSLTHIARGIGTHTYSCNISCNFHCDPKHLT